MHILLALRSPCSSRDEIKDDGLKQICEKKENRSVRLEGRVETSIFGQDRFIGELVGFKCTRRAQWIIFYRVSSTGKFFVVTVKLFILIKSTSTTHLK